MNTAYFFLPFENGFVGPSGADKINGVSRDIYVNHIQLDIWLLPHLGPPYVLLVG